MDIMASLENTYIYRIFVETFNDPNVINIFPIFAGRKKRRGYGYLVLAGAVMAGNFIHDSSIF